MQALAWCYGAILNIITVESRQLRLIFDLLHVHKYDPGFPEGGQNNIIERWISLKQGSPQKL